jgi:hypothetical protein
MWYGSKELKLIFENDTLGLLKTKPISSPITSDQRLISSFEEINTFFSEHNREPSETLDIIERKLFSRLYEIRKDSFKIKELKKFDKFNLLGEIKEIKTIDDILENDHLGILDSSKEEEIFKLENINSNLKRNKTDFVARRTPCKNFSNYENKFKEIHKDIKDGKRKLLIFKEQDLKEGRYFVLDGILLFLEKVGSEKRIFNDKSKGQRVRADSRILCIFENGLESNMYLRSLQKLLYQNGSYVSETNEEAINIFNENLGKLASQDKKTGYVYILNSLSEDLRIKNMKNLHKIGYCTTSVEQRIINAKFDPTFLMSEVKIIQIYEIHNVNPQKFENLIHSFFRKRCLDISIVDLNGETTKPKEWYVVPFRVIDRVVSLLENGEIINYRYDYHLEDIVKK